MEEFQQRMSKTSPRRYERLQHLHGVLGQNVRHEARLVSERTNNFLLFSSILFTGFVLLATQVDDVSIWVSILIIGLPVVGGVISYLHAGIIARTVDAADFWRSTIGLIEQDPDFWEPHKVNNDTDLDIWSARDRNLKGTATRQAQHPLRLGQIPRFIKKLHPNRIFGFWLPLLICILWLFAFIWGCVQLYMAHFNA